jgi:hypothetical protein
MSAGSTAGGGVSATAGTARETINATAERKIGMNLMGHLRGKSVKSPDA